MTTPPGIMTDNPFSSLPAFRQAFHQGLLKMLENGGLGPFILVCANASFDPDIQTAASDKLSALFDSLKARIGDALESGRSVTEVEEDLLVFLKIQAIGLEKLKQTESRMAGKWALQFNHLRSFRPKRITANIPAGIRADFDENGFHFNKGFMQKEAFWAGEVAGKPATLYYNKYPFIDFHGLLVPERERCMPQFLTETYHNYIWELTQQLAHTLPGTGFGYNSLGAFASVNHLHFQMFVRPEGMPVMHPDWSHNDGNEPYPTQVNVFTSVADAWRGIEKLHQSETPYNLLYTHDRLYLFPRKKQGTYPQPNWTSGFTWHEMAGGMITFNRDDYDGLNEPGISGELASLAVNLDNTIGQD